MFMLIGSLMMGAVLVVGQRLFPDFTVMWFASAGAQAMMWREGLLAGLVLTAFIRQYYDGQLVRLLWAMIGVALLWSGISYFMTQPAFIFDSLYMLGAGVYFTVAGLQRVPSEVPHAELLENGQTARHARRVVGEVRTQAGAWAGLVRVLAQTMSRSAHWLTLSMSSGTSHELQDSSHVLSLHDSPLRHHFT